MVPLAARRLGMPVKWTEDRREHFIGSTHERKQVHHVRVGASDDGRILALETSFLHDSGAYCPYGLIIPIITAAQLPGPYRLDNYRYDFTACSPTASPTSPYRGAGRPHARVRDGADHGPPRGRARASTARRSAAATSSSRTSSPTTSASRSRTAGRPSTTPATTRPASTLLLEAVDYDGFEAQPRGGARRGADARPRDRLLRRGHRHRPVRGRGDRRPGRRHRDRRDRPVEPGPGPPDDPRPDRRRRARRADRAHPGHDRRHPPAGLGRRHVREPHRGRLRQRRPQGRGRGPPAGRRAGRPAPRGRPRGPRVRRRRGRASSARPAAASSSASSPRWRTRCATRSARSRPRRRCSPGACTRRRRSRSRTGRRPASTRPSTTAPPSGVFGFGMHAAVVEVDAATCDVRILDYVVGHDCGRIINPIDRRGADVRRRRAGDRRRAVRADGLRRPGPAAERELHGLPDALRDRGARRPSCSTPRRRRPTTRSGSRASARRGRSRSPRAIANAISDAIGIPIDTMPISPSDLFELLHA